MDETEQNDEQHHNITAHFHLKCRKNKMNNNISIIFRMMEKPGQNRYRNIDL